MSEPGTERFCSQCGRSLIPLDIPHVERPCADCGRSVFLVERADDGGIQIREGDKFTIPAGWLTMSLDPSKATGRFFRHGVTWYVTRLLTDAVPTNREDLESFLDRYFTQAEELLESSPKLAHLDLESEQDAEAGWNLIEQGSPEWWATIMGSSVLRIREAREAGAVDDAILAAVQLQTAHTMLVYLNQLDEHVWTGYRHLQQVYDIASAAARTPREAELIQALRPTFAQLSEDVLHAWVESGVAIGERIGVTELEEPLLRELARFHLNMFDRRRRDDELASDRRGRAWANRWAGAGAMAAVAGAVVGILKATGGL